MKLLVACLLLALPLASLLAAPTASARCASQPIVVEGQTVALVGYNDVRPGGPACVLSVIVYDCTASESTDLSVTFTCTTTPVLQV